MSKRSSDISYLMKCIFNNKQKINIKMKKIVDIREEIIYYIDYRERVAKTNAFVKLDIIHTKKESREYYGKEEYISLCYIYS